MSSYGYQKNQQCVQRSVPQTMSVSRVTVVLFVVLLFFVFAAIEFGTLDEEMGVTQTEIFVSTLLLVVLPGVVFLTVVWYLERR